MTPIPAYEALLARIEGASGADRELDIAIADALFPLRRMSPEVERALGYMPGTQEPRIILPPRRAGPDTEAIPQWTASIDATLALVARKLPGAWFRIDYAAARIAPNIWRCELADMAGNPWAWGPTAPLAILIGLLRALIARRPSPLLSEKEG